MRQAEADQKVNSHIMVMIRKPTPEDIDREMIVYNRLVTFILLCVLAFALYHYYFREKAVIPLADCVLCDA